MNKFLLESENRFLRQAINSHLAFDQIAQESEQAFKEIAQARPSQLLNWRAAPPAATPPAAATSQLQQQPPRESGGQHLQQSAASSSSSYLAAPEAATSQQQLADWRAAPPTPQEVKQLGARSKAQGAPVGYPKGQKRSWASVPEASPSLSQPQTRPVPQPKTPPQPPSAVASAAATSQQRQQYTEDELLELRAESDVAAQLGLSWYERGPPPSHGPLWRNQEYRHGTERWANRGGAAKDWYTAYYKAKRSLDKQALNRWLDANPKPGKP